MYLVVLLKTLENAELSRSEAGARHFYSQSHSLHAQLDFISQERCSIMEIELHPAVFLVKETFNVLVAPVEMLVDALNSHPNLTCNAIKSSLLAATTRASLAS